MTNQRALANLLDAVEGVLAYDWCDNDEDAVEAIERLRKANDDYGVVQRFAAEPTRECERCDFPDCDCAARAACDCTKELGHDPGCAANRT